MNKSLVKKEHHPEDIKRLKSLLSEAIVFRETTLASGKKSHYYLDARLITLSSEGSMLVGRILLNFLQNYNIEAVGGLTMGADPISSAVSVVSCIEDVPINAFIVRKEAKAHGRQRQVEGPSIEGKNVLIVDDVVTSGGSLVQAAEVAVEHGAKVVLTTAIVDRQEGASELITSKGFAFKPIFTVKELL